MLLLLFVLFVVALGYEGDVNDPFDVIVAGGGIGGLTAAATLASVGGQRVAINIRRKWGFEIVPSGMFRTEFQIREAFHVTMITGIRFAEYCLMIHQHAADLEAIFGGNSSLTGILMTNYINFLLRIDPAAEIQEFSIPILIDSFGLDLTEDDQGRLSWHWFLEWKDLKSDAEVVMQIKEKLYGIWPQAEQSESLTPLTIRDYLGRDQGAFCGTMIENRVLRFVGKDQIGCGVQYFLIHKIKIHEKIFLRKIQACFGEFSGYLVERVRIVDVLGVSLLLVTGWCNAGKFFDRFRLFWAERFVRNRMVAQQGGLTRCGPTVRIMHFSPQRIRNGSSSGYGRVWVKGSVPSKAFVSIGNAKQPVVEVTEPKSEKYWIRNMKAATKAKLMNPGVKELVYELPFQSEVGTVSAPLLLISNPNLRPIARSDRDICFSGGLLGGGRFDRVSLYQDFVAEVDSVGIKQASLNYVSERDHAGRTFLHELAKHASGAPSSEAFRTLLSVLRLNLEPVNLLLVVRDSYGSCPIDYATGSVVAVLREYHSPVRDAKSGYSTKTMDRIHLHMEEMCNGEV